MVKVAFEFRTIRDNRLLKSEGEHDVNDAASFRRRPPFSIGRLSDSSIRVPDEYGVGDDIAALLKFEQGTVIVCNPGLKKNLFVKTTEGKRIPVLERSCVPAPRKSVIELNQAVGLKIDYN